MIAGTLVFAAGLWLILLRGRLAVGVVAIAAGILIALSLGLFRIEGQAEPGDRPTGATQAGRSDAKRRVEGPARGGSGGDEGPRGPGTAGARASGSAAKGDAAGTEGEREEWEPE